MRVCAFSPTREIETLKQEHAQSLARERGECERLEAKLATVRVMRDMLLGAHQSTESMLTSEASALMAAVAHLQKDVEERRMHMEHRAKVNSE